MKGSKALTLLLNVLWLVPALNHLDAFAESKKERGFQIITYDVPTPSDTGSITASGTAGEQISWTFQNHILTLTGCGEMASDAEFSILGSSIYQVIFDGNITTISDRAFMQCTSLRSVVLPDTLRSIGDSAFFYTNISEIILPYGCESIGNAAFSFSTLQTISIPDTVINIGNEAFGILPDPTEPLPYAYSSVHSTIICNPDSYASQYAKEHTLTTIAFGDVDSDGMLGIDDVILLREYLISGRSVAAAMDMNGDMSVNAKDLTLLKRRVILKSFLS